MKIVNIKHVGKKEVYDISVADAEHYVLENGVVTHNTGNIYASDNIFIIGKQQEKDGTELAGWNFIINIEKSRYTKEKTKIPILVTFEGGLSKYTGLLDMALEAGVVVKPKNARYSRVIDFETGEIEEKKYRAEETDTEAFWEPILKAPQFNDWIKNTYQISSTNLIQTIESPIEFDLEDIE